MRLLGLDTATAATVVAWLDTESGTAVQRRDDPPRGARPRHTARLLELVAEVMDAAGADWTAVDRIAAGIGPGTFTGLRIGVASARALAAAHEIPIVGVSTLRSLALGAAEEAATHGRGVLAVIDARRSEVFAAGWAPGAAGDAGSEPALPAAPVAPERLAQGLVGAPSSWLAVGEGAVESRALLERTGTIIPPDEAALHRVSAVAHCRLAARRPAQPLGHVRPDYLREPDAELTRRAREAAGD